MTTTNIDLRLSEQISAYASVVEGTSLYLLRAIEVTVDALGAEEKLMRGTLEAGRDLQKRMAALKVRPGCFVDPDDSAINTLEASYRGLEEMLPRILAKKGFIDEDGNLKPDHCELLRNSYDSWLSTAGTLVELLKGLRASIIKHDLAVERATTNTESFDTVDGLVESLHSRTT